MEKSSRIIIMGKVLDPLTVKKNRMHALRGASDYRTTVYEFLQYFYYLKPQTLKHFEQYL